MAKSSTSKHNLDRALTIVTEYSNRWRYSYNAAKSNIMVYGESRREFKIGRKDRMFNICNERVKEAESYDHMGIKNCLFSNYKPRTEERISKGRRAFNAITSVGIKRKGVSMKVCSTLFCSIIAPIVTYGSKIWVLRGDEIESIRKFQRMVGRRCQRLHPKSPNYSVYLPLGWMSLDRFIQGKKLMFLRTILNLEDDAICKRVLMERAREFSENVNIGKLNRFDSPIFEILSTSIDVGLYETCMSMILRGHVFTKNQWKKVVWDAMWRMEDEDCVSHYKNGRVIPTLFSVIDRTFYIIWWIMSDKGPNFMRMCEKMVAMITDSSLLKGHDLRLKNASHWSKVCERCNLGVIEDLKHITMQCPFYEEHRISMYREIAQLQCDEINVAMENPQDIYPLILGKQPDNVSIEDMLHLCTITGKWITSIYDSVIIR